jgi:hypothetical protein
MATSKKDAKSSSVREPGKSLLPLSRVQKILKADKVRGNRVRLAVIIEFIRQLGAANGSEGSDVLDFHCY